jgi:AraC-like DNA-binding protein
MLFTFEDRPSDSPFVERIWRAHSERSGDFTSIAASLWEMVVTRLEGNITLTVRGPETRPTTVHCPAEGEWLGIRFKLGTYIPQFPASMLLDQGLNLPNTRATAFSLDGSTWDFPDFENADLFVRRLVRDGVIARDPIVEAALRGKLKDFTSRTARRHFARTTGLTPSTARQIARARYATILLQEGLSIGDVVYEAGYYDQSHLTRSLKRYIGRTPAQLAAGSESLPLSYLYKTTPSR